MRLCAVSVDLDEVPNYHLIHGLPLPSDGSATLVYDRALERLTRFAAAADIPLTLFAVGADLARPESSAALKAAASAGHEIANHSLSHLYDFTRRGRDEMAREVEEAATAIAAAVGGRPRGFRAPGYTVTDMVFDVLAELEVAYDSSVFPCPPYYAAKAAAMASLRARGRRSRSVLDTPAVLTAPSRPYRVARPYWKRGAGVLELPIQVTRRLRLPYIGTFLMGGGPNVARWLTRGVVGEPLVNLELHGIDALDVSDGLHAIAASQPDVRRPARLKLDALSVAIELLRAHGYCFVRLEEAASAFAGA